MRAVVAIGLLSACAVSGCTNEASRGCFPEGCEYDLSCEAARCNIDEDGDGVSSMVDCNDQDAAVHPLAAEICGNGRDDNCDESLICDGGTVDADGDEYASTQSGGSDCDDTNPMTHPDAEESCGGGVDDDCDGSSICDGGTEDADGDEYASVESGGSDCDDSDDSVFPGAIETCGDLLDNDCDGSIVCDGGDPSGDADGDGFAALSAGGTDCNDDDPQIHPGAAEDCETSTLESCGSMPCSDGFVRVPLDGAPVTAVAQLDAQTWLAGTNDGRLYRSENAGISWGAATELGSGMVSAIIAQNATDVVVGVNRNPLANTGVWTSSDAGVTFTPADAFGGINLAAVTDLAWADGDPFGLWVTIAGSGLHQSSDGGVTFVRSGADTIAPFARAVAEHSGTLYVLTDDGLYRSDDGGQSFSGVDVALPNTASLEAARIVSIDNALYLLLDEGGVLVSRDAGATFNTLPSLPSDRPRDLLELTTGEILLATADSGLWTSSDEGQSWQRRAQTSSALFDLEAFEQGSALAASARGIFAISADNVQARTSGMDGLCFRHLALSPEGKMALGGCHGSLFWSLDGRSSWRSAVMGDAPIIAIDWREGGQLLSVLADGAIALSSGSDEEARVLVDLEQPITAAAFHADGRVAVAVGMTTSRIFVLHPEREDRLDEISGLPEVGVDCLSWLETDLLAGARDGNVYAKRESQESFAPVNASPGSGPIAALAAASSQSLYAAVVGDAGGLFRSEDAGESFVRVGPERQLRSVCVDSSGTQLGLVSTDEIAVSNDEGATWVPAEGPPNGIYGAVVPSAYACALESAEDGITMWLPTLERGLWGWRLP